MSKLGFYTVAGQGHYERKLEALLEANKTQADVAWNFNDEVYDKQNWTLEPAADLRALYKQRAQQIRDEYDYVILMVSGGADSTNVVYSFLENGIHVDEVIASAPLSGLRDWRPTTDTNPGNAISETMLAQIPLLHEITTRWPRTKITIHDYFEDILDYDTDEWIHRGSVHMNLSVAKHYLDRHTHIKNRALAGQRIAKVYGIDKPWLLIGKDQSMYAAISDQVVQVPIYQTLKEPCPNLETVLFYYSPDLPELTIKQAHEMARWVYLPGNEVALRTIWDRNTTFGYQMDRDRFTVHHRLIADCIYPSVTKKVFQANKAFGGFAFIPFDNWFTKLHGATRSYQLIKSDSETVLNQLSSKYLTREGGIFHRHVKYWKLGPVSHFQPLQSPYAT